MILCIDPGDDTGWALWSGRSLHSCGLGVKINQLVLVPAISVDEIAMLHIERAFIEWPVIYPRSPVPPNDILMLARSAAEIGGALKDRGLHVDYIEPSSWKGQTPKKVHNARTKAKIKAKLSRAEQEAVSRACAAVAPSAAHNILDAVGLGLWALKL